MPRGGARPGAGRKPNPDGPAKRPPKVERMRRAAEKTIKPKVEAMRAEAPPLRAPLAVRKAHAKRAEDVLSEAMNTFYGLAARYQVTPDNPHADEARFDKYLIEARKTASDLIRYQTPALAAVTLRQQPMDLSRLSETELADLERLYAKAAIADRDQDGAGQTVQ